MSHTLLVPGLRFSRSLLWHSGRSGKHTANHASAFWLFEAPLCPIWPPRFFTDTASVPSASSTATTSTSSSPPAAAAAVRERNYRLALCARPVP